MKSVKYKVPLNMLILRALSASISSSCEWFWCVFFVIILYMKKNSNLNENHIDFSSMSRTELETYAKNLQTEVDSITAKLNWYEEQYKLSRERRYGKSSEADFAGQMDLSDFMLFNEAEALREPMNFEATPVELTTEETPQKGKGKRNKKVTSLPVTTSTYELTEEEAVCPDCGEQLHEMKTVERVEIEVIPAKVQVHKYVSKVYACRNCEKHGGAKIITAPGAPAPVIPKSIASSSLIADAISKKYVDATPFYRQEQNYKRQSVPVTRNNMCNWSIYVADHYFKYITDMMRAILYEEPAIHCDETFVEVLREENKAAYQKSYVWVTATAEYQKDYKIALYNYTPDRSDASARKVLKGYSGYIMCDGYQVYDSIAKRGKHGEDPMDVKSVACLVHVRRKFTDALKLLPPKERAGTSAQKAVDMIARIFDIDNKLNDLTPDKRYKARKKENEDGKLSLERALEEFFEWIDSEMAISLPKTKYGQALTYAMDQKTKVIRVLEDGRLELDNSLAERTVKPFVIGRKNWLFANTPGGADASCILYSIVETAKLNNLIPYEYIKYILDKMPSMIPTEENIKSLLPWSDHIPEYIKTPEYRAITGDEENEETVQK